VTPPVVTRLAGLLRPALPLFWGCWLAVVTASNVTNGLRVAGVLPAIPFASSNFELIETTTAIYHLPRAGVWALLAGVIAWEAVAAALYLRAGAALARGRAEATAAVDAAACAGMGLFAAFMLADELCIAYPLQGTHMRIFIAQGVTWLMVRGLPTRPPANG
jgi:hypothetical protein